MPRRLWVSLLPLLVGCTPLSAVAPAETAVSAECRSEFARIQGASTEGAFTPEAYATYYVSIAKFGSQADREAARQGLIARAKAWDTDGSGKISLAEYVAGGCVR